MSLPLWFKGLTPELRKEAEDTLGETPEVREKAILELKTLLQDRDDVCSRTDDVFLLRFLRTKKYDVQNSLRLLLNYYAFREKQRGSFVGIPPSKLKHIIQMNTMLYSPRRTPCGSHLAVYRLGSFDTSRASARELLSAVFLVGELIQECEATQVCGGTFVVDMEGMTIQHYTQFFAISYLSFVISIVQIRFHGRNLNSLHEYVPKDLLPQELGGHLGISDYSVFSDHFFDQESFVERNGKYGLVGKSVQPLH